MLPLLYICYASSDYYARETGISLIGFFENNPDYEPEIVFILDYGILTSNRIKLNSIAAHYGKAIEYLPAKQILENIQNTLKIKDFRGSLATYSRAFIDKIMPDYVQRLLYIDSDTVVVGSISALKSFKMGKACMAGIVAETFSSSIKKGKLQLYSGNSKYYGCGVVLFDIKNWRTNNSYDRIVDMLATKRIFPCADQTLINNSLNEDCFCKLPRKFNYNTHIYSKRVEYGILKSSGWNTEEEIQDTITNPVVIHYPGRPVDRPWYNGCTSRFKDYYYKYKKISPWKDDFLYNIPSNSSFVQKYDNFLHSLEVKSSAFFVLVLVKFVRFVFADILRYIGLIKPIKPEGIEK